MYSNKFPRILIFCAFLPNFSHSVEYMPVNDLIQNPSLPGKSTRASKGDVKHSKSKENKHQHHSWPSQSPSKSNVQNKHYRSIWPSEAPFSKEGFDTLNPSQEATSIPTESARNNEGTEIPSEAPFSGEGFEASNPSQGGTSIPTMHVRNNEISEMPSRIPLASPTSHFDEHTLAPSLLHTDKYKNHHTSIPSQISKVPFFESHVPTVPFLFPTFHPKTHLPSQIHLQKTEHPDHYHSFSLNPTEYIGKAVDFVPFMMQVDLKNLQNQVSNKDTVDRAFSSEKLLLEMEKYLYENWCSNLNGYCTLFQFDLYKQLITQSDKLAIQSSIVFRIYGSAYFSKEQYPNNEDLTMYIFNVFDDKGADYFLSTLHQLNDECFSNIIDIQVYGSSGEQNPDFDESRPYIQNGSKKKLDFDLERHIPVLTLMVCVCLIGFLVLRLKANIVEMYKRSVTDDFESEASVKSLQSKASQLYIQSTFSSGNGGSLSMDRSIPSSDETSSSPNGNDEKSLSHDFEEIWCSDDYPAFYSTTQGGRVSF